MMRLDTISLSISLALMLGGLLLHAAVASAATPTAGKLVSDCESLADQAEDGFGLPKGMLASISRVEAGRIRPDGSRRGWPWTINHAGKGLFFDNKADTLAYLEKHLAKGDTAMDVGCMQISIKWHSHRFDSLEEMLDPFFNIAYAAAFLDRLKQRHGSWDEAIRRYHSADTRYNSNYVKKVYAVWKGGPEPAHQPAVAATPAILLKDKPPAVKSPAAKPSMLGAVIKPLPKPSAPAPVMAAVASPAAPQVAKVSTPQPVIPAGSPATLMVEKIEHKKEMKPEPTVIRPADPDHRIKSRQRYLAARWKKVEHFRQLLSQQLGPAS